MKNTSLLLKLAIRLENKYAEEPTPENENQKFRLLFDKSLVESNKAFDASSRANEYYSHAGNVLESYERHMLAASAIKEVLPLLEELLANPKSARIGLERILKDNLFSLKDKLKIHEKEIKRLAKKALLAKERGEITMAEREKALKEEKRKEEVSKLLRERGFK